MSGGGRLGSIHPSPMGRRTLRSTGRNRPLVSPSAKTRLYATSCGVAKTAAFGAVLIARRKWISHEKNLRPPHSAPRPARVISHGGEGRLRLGRLSRMVVARFGMGPTSDGRAVAESGV